LEAFSLYVLIQRKQSSPANESGEIDQYSIFYHLYLRLSPGTNSLPQIPLYQSYLRNPFSVRIS